VKRNKKQTTKTVTCKLAALLAATLIAGCQLDKGGDDDNSNDGQSAATAGGSDTLAIDSYRLSLPNQTVNLTEGSEVSATIRVERSSGYSGQVTIGAEPPSQSDGAELTWTFTNTRITNNENATSINIKLDYNSLPIQPQLRTLRILATDGTTQRSADLNINVAPTSLPDVYLLIGQSNMVGFSEQNAKQAVDDAPDERIRQLNVTGNDPVNFSTAASFTSDAAIAVADPRYPSAIDPLHHGFDSSINGKSGTQVGLGLSFAKRAIENTQASNIYLVPAAWSDTGFCRRERLGELQAFEGVLGWNATPPTSANTLLSGTLLHDRAIARTNLTLRETNGILRGILWHQGEADAQNSACAGIYQQNLINLVKSLRENIIPDARGPNARSGLSANVPFVVGTMSKGFPYQNPVGPRLTVDNVHRSIKDIVPFSAFVNNDDLVPPQYPCGDGRDDGDCTHFGSSAYRLMGSRYYDQLLEAAIGQ